MRGRRRRKKKKKNHLKSQKYWVVENELLYWSPS
jgi:hypothetical protein